MDKIFSKMDKDNDRKLTFEEFVEGFKQDPAIAKVHHSAHLHYFRSLMLQY